MTEDGPAAKASWTIGEDGKLNIGLGLDREGHPKAGVEMRMRF